MAKLCGATWGRGRSQPFGGTMKTRVMMAVAMAAGLAASAGAAGATIAISSENAGPGNTALGDGVINGGLLADGMVMIDNFGDHGGSISPLTGFTFVPEVVAQG